MAKNLEHWKNWCRHYPSPDSFIEASFYSMMGSALQRRIWVSSQVKPLYCNTYFSLVGPPASGKSIVIEEVDKILRTHLMYQREMTAEQTEKMKELEARVIGLKDNAVPLAQLRKLSVTPPLLQVGADCTTFESFVQELSKATRTFKLPDGKSSFHSSCTFTLGELSNLLGKYSEDLFRLLNYLYDCKNFQYKTKHQGDDIIQNGCVSILAGTTYDFLRTCFTNKRLNEGMSSRFMFVCEENPRNKQWDWPEPDAEQLAGMELIKLRILHMNKLAGFATLSPDAEAYAKFYYEVEQPQKRNPNPILDNYYGRIRSHMFKICAAAHFADSDSLVMGRESMEQAVMFLENIEKKMHLALEGQGLNKNSDILKRVYQYLVRKGDTSEGVLLFHFIDELENGSETLNRVLDDLRRMGKVAPTAITNGKAQKWKAVKGNVESLAGETVEEKRKTDGQKMAELLAKLETKESESEKT